MHTNSDDLSEVERRLAARASAAGLDADAMLFAAGRASARPGPARFVWPALAACLAVVSVGLGLWLRAERNERLSLTERLQQPAPIPAAAPRPPPAPAPTADEPPPNSVLASHRALEQGLDAWPPVPVVDPPGPPPPDWPALRVGRPDTLPDL